MSKILIVEDEFMNRDMIMRRLTWEGYEVVMAANGEEALRAVISEKPELILMDLGLPRMNGWEVTRRLRTDTQTSDIPIIALSAYALMEDRARAFDVGCDDFETKPIEFPRLLNKIEQLLVTRVPQTAS